MRRSLETGTWEGVSEEGRRMRPSREMVCHEKCSKFRIYLGLYLHSRHRWKWRFSEK